MKSRLMPLKLLVAITCTLIIISLQTQVLAQWEYPTLLMPITISDGTTTVVDTFGCHGGATNCIDGELEPNLWEEEYIWPLPPAIDARFIDHRGDPNCLGTGVRLHLQEFFALDTFWLNITVFDTTRYPLTLTWSSIQGTGNEFWSGLTLTDRADGMTINVDMQIESSAIIPSPLYSNLQIVGTALLAGVEDDRNPVPSNAVLYQNYPNPFNGSTNITYYLPARDHISLTVFDAVGRIVMRILDRVEQPGLHTVNIKPSLESSGVYYYRLLSDAFDQTKSFVFLK